MRSILIVEDCPDLRTLLARALRGEGFEARSAANGFAALALLKSGYRPDLILLDICMPEMSGEKFLSILKEIPACSHIRTVVLSGLDNLSVKAGEIGADDFLKKPVDLNIFCEQVHRQLAAASLEVK